MKLAYKDSVARRLSQDIKASEDRVRLLGPSHRTLHVPSLRSMLPDRRTVDILLKKYFDTFETTLRIIHIPTFNVAYETYWDVDSAGNSEIDAIILAILACTGCTSTHTTPRYNHIGSTFHSKAVLWIRTLEVWLKRQSNKSRSLATLQVRCLRLLALSTTSLKVKEYYQEVQYHVAIMRSAGMHRDPSIFGTRCTLLEGEMRRRLWATTMEIEIQASVDRGTVHPVDFPSRNLLTVHQERPLCLAVSIGTVHLLATSMTMSLISSCSSCLVPAVSQRIPTQHTSMLQSRLWS
jgi:hypothetical protein